MVFVVSLANHFVGITGLGMLINSLPDDVKRFWDTWGADFADEDCWWNFIL
jgi:hypothetical protein